MQDRNRDHDQHKRTKRQGSDHDQQTKRNPKPKPRPKHGNGSKSGASKPVARAPGVAPIPKAAKVGVRDPWSDSASAPEAHAPRREEVHEGSEAEEHESTDELVGDALGYVDDAHLGFEALLSGGTSGKGLSGLAAALGAEQTELVAGELAGVDTAFGAAGAAIASPASIVGGTMELLHGWEELDHDTAGGALTMLSGGASVTSGVAGLAALGGSPVLAATAPAAAAAGAGIKIGRYGDAQARQAGWLHDNNGEATAPSTWSADRGEDAERWVTKHTHNHTLGAIAGGATAIGSALTVGGATAIGGAINGGVLKAEDFGTDLGKMAAREHRSDAYAGSKGSTAMDAVDGIGYRNPYTGQVSIAERGTDEARAGGRQMAEYDDQLSDAVERAKVLHPEQWGEAQNTVSMTNQVAARMRAIGGGKESK